MKHMKKFVSVLLALVMVLAMTVTAFAAEDTEPTGSIKIQGSADEVENKGVTVAGKKFTAYKILDLKMVGDDGYVYTVPEALKDFYAERFAIPADAGDFDYRVTQKIRAMQENSDDLFAFAADALKAAKAANEAESGSILTQSVTGSEGNTFVTISDLPYGYYVVEDEGAAEPISALFLDTVDPDMIVTLKAHKPTVDKNIDGDNDTDDSTSGNVKNNNEAIGDKVPYKVTTKVPDMTGYTKYYFVLSDTLSKGLTFNDDVLITLDGTTLTRVYMKAETAEVEENGETHTKTTVTYYSDEALQEKIDYPQNAYTVTKTENADGTTAVEIVFLNFIQYKDQKGTDIVVTYSATLNKNAVIGTAGNENTVKLDYSNNPNKKVDGEPDNPDKPSEPVGETPNSVTRTFVTGIELIKVDPAGNRLTGAEFTITGEKTNIVLVSEDVYTENVNGTYWKLKDGSYTTDDPATSGMDQSKYEDTSTKYCKTTTTEEKAVVYVEDVNGEYWQLKNGSYTKTAPTIDTSAKYEDTNKKYSKHTTDLYIGDNENGTYWKLKDGTYTDVEPTEENKTDYASTTIKYRKVVEKIDARGTVGEDGVLRFEGLSAGTYTIKEIKAPEGYNLLKDPIDVTITWKAPTESATTCTWTAAGGGATVENGIVKIKVENKTGSILPTTGGIGTTIFYVLGSILLVGAAIMLIVRRRMSAAN